jgi:hypothetical protein
MKRNLWKVKGSMVDDDAFTNGGATQQKKMRTSIVASYAPAYEAEVYKLHKPKAAPPPRHPGISK